MGAATCKPAMDFFQPESPESAAIERHQIGSDPRANAMNAIQMEKEKQQATRAIVMIEKRIAECEQRLVEEIEKKDAIIEQLRPKPKDAVLRQRAKTSLTMVNACNQRLLQLETERGNLQASALASEMAVDSGASVAALRENRERLRKANAANSTNDVLETYADLEQTMDEHSEISAAIAKPLQQRSASVITDDDAELELNALLAGPGAEVPLDFLPEAEVLAMSSVKAQTPSVTTGGVQRRRMQQGEPLLASH